MRTRLDVCTLLTSYAQISFREDYSTSKKNSAATSFAGREELRIIFIHRCIYDSRTDALSHKTLQKMKDSFVNINIAQFGLQKAKERLGLKREKGLLKFFLTFPSY